MSRVVVAAVAVCALAGALAWWFLHTPASDAASSRDLATANADQTADQTESPTAGLSARAPETHPVGTKPRPISAVEPDSGGTTASRTSMAGRKLRVVLAPDDAPAAGVTVEFLAVDSEQAAMELFPEGELRAGTKLTPVIADDAGNVTLPPFKLAAFVRGQSGDRRGRTFILPNAPDETILRLRRGVVALVVDSGKVPQAGVPVAILDGDSDWPTMEAKTGPDGLATIFPDDRRGGRRRRDAGSKQSRSVALNLPVAERVEKKFDPDSPPESPLELVMPALGSLVVKLVGRDDMPFMGAATVRVQPKHPGEVSPMRDGGRFGCVSEPAAGGTATFRWVGFDGALEVAVEPGDASLRSAGTIVEGPREPGPPTTVTVKCGGLATIVTGRLVTSSGQPVVRASLEGEIVTKGDEQPDDLARRAWRADMTPDGRFTLRFELDPATLEGAQIDIEVGELPEGDYAVASSQQKRNLRPLPPTIKSGTADVGDVVVPDVEVLAAGIVVNQDGEPLGPAELTVMRRQMMEWSREHTDVAGLRAGRDGRFEIKGTVPSKGLGLIARMPGWICTDPTPFAAGARDLKIVMTQAGGIEGSVTNFGSQAWGTYSEAPFQVRLTGSKAWLPKRNEGRGYTSGAGLSLDVEDDGVFAARSLPAGTYGFQIRAHGAREPLVAVNDLVVKAGETNRDPRLQNIDLSKLVNQRIVTVVNEQKKPLARATVAVITPGDGMTKFLRFQTDSEGRAVVTTPSGTFDAVIATSGYRAVTLSNVSADVTATLHEAKKQDVTITLADSVTLPEPPFELSADLEWLCALHEARPSKADWADPRNAHVQVTFGKKRSVVIEVQNPGVYQVALYLRKTEGKNNFGMFLDQKGGKAIVTVLETGAPSVTVEIDPAVLEKQIAERLKEK